MKNLERSDSGEGLRFGFGLDCAETNLTEEDDSRDEDQDSAIESTGLFGFHAVKKEDVHVAKCADE